MGLISLCISLLCPCCLSTIWSSKLLIYWEWYYLDSMAWSDGCTMNGIPKSSKRKRSGRLDVPIKMSFRHPQFQVGHTSITLDDWTMGLTHTEQGGTTNCTLQRPRFDKYSHVIICTCSWVNEIRASWFERLANLYPNIGHNVRYHRSLWLWACDIAGLIFLNKKKKLRPFLFYRY